MRILIVLALLAAQPAHAISVTKFMRGEVSWRQVACSYWPGAKLCRLP